MMYKHELKLTRRMSSMGSESVKVMRPPQKKPSIEKRCLNFGESS